MAPAASLLASLLPFLVLSLIVLVSGKAVGVWLLSAFQKAMPTVLLMDSRGGGPLLCWLILLF